MASLRGPLFSIDADGQLGKALVYAKWKGRNYVRKWLEPNNPKTFDQLLVRNRVDFLNAWWQSIRPQVEPSWIPIAAEESYSPFNAYFSTNLDRLKNALYPLAAADGIGPTTMGSLQDFDATGGINRIKLTFVYLTTPAETDLLIVSISPDNGNIASSQTPSRVIYHKANDPQGIDFEQRVLNIPNGLYRVSAVFLQSDGTEGVWLTSPVSVNVTGDP